MDRLDPRPSRGTAFTAADVPQGQVRDRFLRSTGVYTSAAPVTRRGAQLPARLALRQNQPNPFGGVTTIGFDLPVASAVRLEVFDLLGRRICVLAESHYPPGRHSVEWNRRDAGGTAVRPGSTSTA